MPIQVVKLSSCVLIERGFRCHAEYLVRPACDDLILIYD